MDNGNKIEQLPFSLSPERRLYEDFPWQIWAIGWLSFFKAISWIFLDPILPEKISFILFYKYILLMLPFLIFGIGVLNLRKWAAKGIFILCCAELFFFIGYPSSLASFAVETDSILSLLSSAINFVIHGPMSDIFILIYIPILFKHFYKYFKQ